MPLNGISADFSSFYQKILKEINSGLSLPLKLKIGENV